MRTTWTAAPLLLAALSAAPSLAGESPVIVQQPADRVLCAGNQSYFWVRAASVGPTTFLWQQETAPEQWEAVPLSPRQGVWERVSVATDDEHSMSYLFFGWIGAGDSRRYRCLVSGPFGSTASEPARLTALTADFGATGGVAEPDFVSDNNDFVVFIDAFFSGSPAADLASTGGVPGGDGSLNNDDFIVFVDLFFNGCIELH
jgi:hypothetical protein